MITNFNKYKLNEKNYFDEYESIIIKLNTIQEVDYAFKQIEDKLDDHLSDLPEFKREIINYIEEGKTPYLRYVYNLNSFKYGTIDYLESDNFSLFTFKKYYTVNDLPTIIHLIKNKGKELPNYSKRKFIYESKYFDKYLHIPILIKNKEELNYAYDYIKKEFQPLIEQEIGDHFYTGTLDYLNSGEEGVFVYYTGTQTLMYGTKKYILDHPTEFNYKQFYNVNELNRVKYIIESGGLEVPTYDRRKFIYESKNYFNEYKSIPIRLRNIEDVNYAYTYIQDHIDRYLNKKISDDIKNGAIGHINNGRDAQFLYYYPENRFLYGTVDGLAREFYNFEKFYTIGDLNKIKNIIKSGGLEVPTYDRRKFIYESKNYFDKYLHIPIEMHNIDEINYVYEYIRDNINEFLNRPITTDFLYGMIRYYEEGEVPDIIYYTNENVFRYGRKSYTESEENHFRFKKHYTKEDLPFIKRIIKNKGKINPDYSKREFVYENILLEKSNLTKLGVPREVMQPIQKDLALSPDADWDKMEHKKDIVDLLRKGDKNLFIQIGIDNIKVIGSYPSPKGTVYFVDNYVYRDTDWSGEFEKLPREYKTLTQTVIEIEPRTNIYKLDGDYSTRVQKRRKLHKKEEEFVDFSEKFKTEFLKRFDTILKRITGTHFKEAKGKISDKAKQIAIENDMLIKSLDNPLSGPNGLTILDEFLYQFEEEYSKYFDERVDIHELSNYFTRDKLMTMFMYYIYTGKILGK